MAARLLIPAATPDDEWLTVAEVMARLRLGRSTVYDLLRSKALPSAHVGRCRRVPLSALRAFMARQLEEAS